MSSKLAMLLLLLIAPFHHPEANTEWWYYTGNLKSQDGHRYGYELTFFRQVNHDAPKSDSVWNPAQLYLAHLALSDLDGQNFEHVEKLNRAGPGLAGAVWNGNWHAKWTSDKGVQQLQAVAADFTLKLNLNPEKPFVVHGLDGISRKGPLNDEFSHYTSFTRLATQGTLERNGKLIPLAGLSWMDHEDFNDVDDPELKGWDWFAIQLENGEELMLYRLRLKSGQESPYSSGTFIDAQGKARHLAANDFKLTPSGYWNSYPLTWHLDVPSLQISLDETTRLKDQELSTPNSVSPAYWEGAVDYIGRIKNQPVKGFGYLEMTGYKSPLHLGH